MVYHSAYIKESTITWNPLLNILHVDFYRVLVRGTAWKPSIVLSTVLVQTP